MSIELSCRATMKKLIEDWRQGHDECRPPRPLEVLSQAAGRRRWVVRAWGSVVPVAMLVLAAGGVARAEGLPASSFGTQGTGPDLSVASAAGVGVNRTGPFVSTAASDALVTTLALAHQRLYPVLGLPCASGGWDCSDQYSPSPSVAATEIGPIVQAFAQRYGPHGSFWAANPRLPYLPVQSFEIGNEENLPTQWVVDPTHMHWAPNSPSDPGAAAGAADYAIVYEAARAALHQVDPSGIAVVGGLADSASYGVDIQSDEQYIGALTAGKVDAIGYHDWVFDVSDSRLETDTADLRTWMDQNGFAGVPINVTEFGACDITPQVTSTGGCNEEDTQSDARWAPYAASYVQWAMCTRSLDVTTMIAFWWGDDSTTGQSVWLPLMSGDGTLTDYGQTFLNDTESLTTTGCPPPSFVGKTSAPPKTATPATPPLLSMDLRILRVTRRGRFVTIEVRYWARSGTVSCTAIKFRRRSVRIHLKGRGENPTTMTCSTRLPVGRWSVDVTGQPSRGYAKPAEQSRLLTVTRSTRVTT